MQIHISRNGQQIGAFEENAVRQMLQNGQLSPNDFGIRQGEAQWQPLGRMFSNSNPIPNVAQFSPNVQSNLQAAAAPKSGASKGCLFALLGLGAVCFIGIAGVFGYFAYYKNRTIISTNSPANKSANSNSSNSSMPKDFTALKDKAEELAKFVPTVKLDSKAKLKGRIAIVEKGKYDAEMKGFDAYYKEINETSLSSYNMTKEMIAKTPEEIDSLVQIICTKGKLIGRYEGNIPGYANNCKVSMIDYRSKTAFAQKTLINSKPEKSISSVYEGGEYIVIPPISEISDYIKTFVPEKSEVSSSDPSTLPNIEDPKTFAGAASNFSKLSFPLKTDASGVIKGKITTIQSSDYGISSAMMIGLDSEGNVQQPLPNAIILTKESLGFTNEQIARKSSEIDTLIQVSCKKGGLITKVKGISVYSNICNVSIIDYKAFATIGQKTFEGKKVDNNRYSDPSIYDDKQATVDFPRTEIEEYIEAFPKA